MTYLYRPRKAIKTHTCAVCHKDIEKGSDYFEATIGGGGLQSKKFPSRLHPDCSKEFQRQKDAILPE